MNNVAMGALALAILAIAVPASAEDVYVGAGPVGVDVGHHHWRRDYDYVRERDFVHHRHCRTVVIREHGYVRKVRRCRD